MSGKINRPGFTFLEVMVAIALISLLATFSLPLLFKRGPRAERELFFKQLNALMHLGWQNALITHSVHQLSFDFSQGTVQLLQQSDKKDDQGNKSFVPLKRAYTKTTLKWPKQLQVRQFFIEGGDEFAREAKTAQVWFFIVPEGLAQQVTINMLDTKDKKNNKPRTVSVVLNPFSAQFSVYDEWQKP